MYKSEKFKINLAPTIEKGLSIICPFHGKYDYLTKFLENVYRYAKGFKFEVIVVDDHSPNTEYLKALANIAYLKINRLNKQSGFGAAVNAGIKQAIYPNVFVAHSDCRIEEANFFVNLYNTMKERTAATKKYCLVSPKTNNHIYGDKAQLGNKGDVTPNVILEDSYLSMYAFMADKALFQKIGLLKEYPYAGYENKEFGVRMRVSKMEQVVCGSAWIFHHGSLTVKEVQRKDITARALMQDNESLYLEDIKKFFA